MEEHTLFHDIKYVLPWKWSMTSHVWLSWFYHKNVMGVYGWQKTGLLWKTCIIKDVYFFLLCRRCLLEGWCCPQTLGEPESNAWASELQWILHTQSLAMWIMCLGVWQNLVHIAYLKLNLLWAAFFSAFDHQDDVDHMGEGSNVEQNWIIVHWSH